MNQLVQELQMVVESFAGSRWHVIRDPDGRWTRFGDLAAAAGGISHGNRGACAGIGAELHVVVDALSLMHTIRHADGSWQKFGNVNATTGYRGGLMWPACAGIGDDLHVCAQDGEKIVHTIRHADGSWDDVGDVTAHAGRLEGNAQAFLAVCGMLGELHVFVVVRVSNPRSESLLHTVRHANGDWSAWDNLSQRIRNVPDLIYALAAAANGPELQIALCAQGARGVVHALRRRNGAWTPFADVYAETGDRGRPYDVSAAAVNGELHLAVASDLKPTLWHAIRHADGTWTRLGDVAAATRRPGTDVFVGVELAGVNQTVHQPANGGPGVCYAGTPGASTVQIQNVTGDDTLSVWRFDASAGQAFQHSSEQATLATSPL